MTESWFSEPRPVDAELVDDALEERLSVLRGFLVKDHLDDRTIASLMELNRGGIGEPVP
jgi:hypothetical protein